MWIRGGGWALAWREPSFRIIMQTNRNYFGGRTLNKQKIKIRKIENGKKMKNGKRETQKTKKGKLKINANWEKDSKTNFCFAGRT